MDKRTPEGKDKVRFLVTITPSLNLSPDGNNPLPVDGAKFMPVMSVTPNFGEIVVGVSAALVLSQQGTITRLGGILPAGITFPVSVTSAFSFSFPTLNPVANQPMTLVVSVLLRDGTTTRQEIPFSFKAPTQNAPTVHNAAFDSASNLIQITYSTGMNNAALDSNDYFLPPLPGQAAPTFSNGQFVAQTNNQTVQFLVGNPPTGGSGKLPLVITSTNSTIATGAAQAVNLDVPTTVPVTF
jgi:hypothetical protein